MRSEDEIRKRLYVSKTRKRRNLVKCDEAGFRAACALVRVLEWVLEEKKNGKTTKNNKKG